MKQKKIALILTLFFGTIVLYWATASYELINLDDYQYTASNKPVSAGLSVMGLGWALTNIDLGIWMPFTWLSYMLDFSVFNGLAGCMHIHNVVLHACNTVALYLFLLLMCAKTANIKDTHKIFIIALATAFWAWHPLRVEPVVWIASRKDVLFTFWYLLALIFWIYRLNAAEPRRNFIKGLAIMCFAFSCMSKPSAMTFPLIAALCEWAVTRRIAWKEYRLIGLLAIGVGFLAEHAQQSAGAKQELYAVPFYGRLLNASAAFGIYCWKTILPSGLAVQCVHRWPALPYFWWQGICMCSLFLLILLLLCVRSKVIKITRLTFSEPAQNTVYVVCGMIFFGLAVIPTLGLSAFGYHAYADRFTYLPAVGWSILIAVALVMKHSRFLNALIGCILMVFLYLSWHQIYCWSNERILFTQTLEVDGDRNPMAHGALALYYYEHEHGSPKALEHFDKAYHYFGNKPFDFMIIQFIEVLSMAGQTNRARDEIRAYMERESKSLSGTINCLDKPIQTTGLSYILYACVNMYEGDYDMAEEMLERGAKYQPDLSELNYLRGRLAFLEGHFDSARFYWEKCIDNRGSYVKYRFLKDWVSH